MFSKGKLSRFLFNEPGPKCTKLWGFGLHSLFEFSYCGKIYLSKIYLLDRFPAQSSVVSSPLTLLYRHPPPELSHPPTLSLCPHYTWPPPPPPGRPHPPHPPFRLHGFDCSRDLMQGDHTVFVFLWLAEFPFFLHLYLIFYFSILFQIKTSTVQISPDLANERAVQSWPKDSITSGSRRCCLCKDGHLLTELKLLYWPWLRSCRALFSIIIISLPKENLNCAESEQLYTTGTLYQAGSEILSLCPATVLLRNRYKWVGSVHKQNISGPPNLGQGN